MLCFSLRPCMLFTMSKPVTSKIGWLDWIVLKGKWPSYNWYPQRPIQQLGQEVETPQISDPRYDRLRHIAFILKSDLQVKINGSRWLQRASKIQIGPRNPGSPNFLSGIKWGWETLMHLKKPPAATFSQIPCFLLTSVVIVHVHFLQLKHNLQVLLPKPLMTL